MRDESKACQEERWNLFGEENGNSVNRAEYRRRESERVIVAQTGTTTLVGLEFGAKSSTDTRYRTAKNTLLASHYPFSTLQSNDRIHTCHTSDILYIVTALHEFIRSGAACCHFCSFLGARIALAQELMFSLARIFLGSK